LARTAPFLVTVALAALVLMIAAPAQATTVLWFDMASHVADSTAVVEATVGSSHQLVDPDLGKPFTYTTVVIEEVLHGRAPATVQVRQMRGVIDGVAHLVPGDGRLREGGRVVLFLTLHADGHWYLTALAQSVWEVKGTSADPSVARDLRDLALMERDAEGRIVTAAEQVDPARLSELKDAIAAAGRGR